MVRVFIPFPFTNGAHKPHPAENKVINFAGQPSARLNRNWTIYETSSRRSGLITTLSPLLFFAPDVHLDKLENVFVDKTINKVHWKTFISKLQDEWREFILYVRSSPITTVENII